jgi:hypothetical protein
LTGSTKMVVMKPGKVVFVGEAGLIQTMPEEV